MMPICFMASPEWHVVKATHRRFAIGIEIAIEIGVRMTFPEADFDPDTDSDFEFGWNPKVELIKCIRMAMLSVIFFRQRTNYG